MRIITVGNKSSGSHQALIDEYMKRFPRSHSVSWQFVKHGSGDPKTSIAQESENILKKINVKDFMVLLDETGEQLTSPQLSTKLFDSSRDITFVIGGAYGVSDEIKQRSDFIWSLSKLVFPHQLVRLILVEQLYRAYTISIDHPYHHQ